MRNVDLVSKLSQCNMHHIIEQIFSYMDYEDLRRAEGVCRKWREAIQQKRIWKGLFHRQMTNSSEWKKTLHVLEVRDPPSIPEVNNETYFRQIACLVGDSTQRLVTNWKNGTYTSCESAFAPNIGQAVPLSGRFFAMNEKWLVKEDVQRSCLVIKNRWSSETERALPLPDCDDEWGFCDLCCVHLNSHFLVAAQYDWSRLVVWDTHSFEVIHMFEDSYPIESTTGAPEVQGVYYEAEPNMLALWGHKILSCGVMEGVGNLVITLRNLDSGAVVTHRQALSEKARLLDVALDGLFAVVFVWKASTVSSQPNLYRIEVRSADNVELLRQIDFKSGRECLFDYADGLIAIGKLEKNIRLFDASNGQHIRTIPNVLSLTDIRLIPKKYLLACDEQGGLRYWDLNDVLNTESTGNLCMKSIDPPIPAKRRKVDVRGIYADEFQIAVVLSYLNPSSAYYLRTIDFLGVTFEEKRTRKNRKRRFALV